MADLAAGDLTYTLLHKEDGPGEYKTFRFAITTAAGEYPTGGLPLTNAKLGCPNELRSLKVLEPSAADELQYVWDRSANKIKVIEDDGTTGVPAEHANATFTSPDQLIVEATGW